MEVLLDANAKPRPAESADDDADTESDTESDTAMDEGACAKA